jgi:AcrR family transcriptional regulator
VVRKSELRRVPQQTRGELRLAKILDAGEKVFAQLGYEAATTNAIARQAKTSIGSLYQFLPNKEAILEAVAARYLERLRAVLDLVLTDEMAYLPLLVVYERIIAALADFHAANPGFRHLFYGSTTSPHLAAAAQRLVQECIQRVDALMAVRFPALAPKRRRLFATINVEVIKALLPLAQSALGEERGEVLEEIRNLLLAHLRQTLGVDPLRARSVEAYSS